MKSVSVEEAIARIEKDIEENKIEPNPDSESDEGIRAAPTANAGMPNGLTPLQSPAPPHYFLPEPPTESDESRHTIASSIRPLSTEEIITELEQQTEESLYQEFIEKWTTRFGEPSDTIKTVFKGGAALNYHRGQQILSVLKYFQNRPPTEMCPVEREQLDRYGELFEVYREEGESDEAYRERIRHLAYPHLP